MSTGQPKEHDMEKIRSGLYRTKRGGHLIELERIDTAYQKEDVGWWTFRIDGDGVAAEPWPTRRQALACAITSIAEH